MLPPPSRPSEHPADPGLTSACRSSRIWARVVAAFAILLTGFLLLTPLPRHWQGGGWRNTLLDLGHVPLFAGLTVALRRVLGGPWYRPVLVSIGVAALGELLQAGTNRSPSLLDLLHGSLGALAAGLVIRGWQGNRRLSVRLCHALAALVLAAWPFLEAAPGLLDEYRAWRDFPILADFEAPGSLSRWEPHQAVLSREPAPGQPEAWAGRLEFLTGPRDYPGAMLRHTVRDWSGYHRLCWSFTVEGSPLPLVFSVRGGPNRQDRSAHLDIGRTFPPGTHQFTLDLQSAVERARPGKLDQANVWYSLVFLVRPDRNRVVHLHCVWLE
jgi:hypothetical protein